MIKLALPEETLDPFFIDAALSGVIADGKILSDAIPLFSADLIVEKYKNERENSDFNMLTFIEQNFILNSIESSSFKTDPTDTIYEHIERLWSFLVREPDIKESGSTLIPLPFKYVVPGGRFNEIYYWDSYFTMLGLRQSGKMNLVESMIDNFAWLIDNIGFIPNGNRTYFLSRSQPPFFAMMIELLVSMKGEAVYAKYRNTLLKEYLFWMNADRQYKNNVPASEHAIYIEGSQVLNRYWDTLDTPRTEMYREDIHLSASSHWQSKEKLFSNLRCACESGWDFSSRWCHDSQSLSTIQTSDIIPVDLNCLMYQMERTLSNCYRQEGDEHLYRTYVNKAEDRKALIIKYCWNDTQGYFFDYNFVTKQQTNSIHMAGIFPLSMGIADSNQASRSLDFMMKHLLSDGGLLTTTIDSGQQWDAPNGWAPLQWMGFQAAINYHQAEKAYEIAHRWTSLITDVFERTGKIMEKYNVVDTTSLSGGGEYPVQDGFGWTNGVFLAMSAWLQTYGTE